MEVAEERIDICGWPTDVLSIDHPKKSDNSRRHTLLLFIPGNPGVIHWYVDFLHKILQHLGEGYAVRGVSYAGHGVGDDIVGSDTDHASCLETNVADATTTTMQKKMDIAWTIEGQVMHKIAWVDRILIDINEQSTPTNLIFISHSIGAHLVQCLLLERPDILARTQHIIHLMPFFRFDPPFMKKAMLSTVAKHHNMAIPVVTTTVRFASYTLPRKFVDICMKHIAGVECDKGRQIALDIFGSPKMVRNHLVLGTQEVRELPERPNDIALRLIGEACSTSILFCDPDQWAPLFHMEDLQRLQSALKIPNNIDPQYLDDLSHDFVVHPEMIEPVVEFCIKCIEQRISNANEPIDVAKLISKL